jgi:hypothetical protein
MTINNPNGIDPPPKNPQNHQRLKVEVLQPDDISKYVSACPICYGVSLTLYQLNKFVPEVQKRMDVPHIKCKDCECEAPLASWNMIRSNRPDPLKQFRKPKTS